MSVADFSAGINGNRFRWHEAHRDGNDISGVMNLVNVWRECDYRASEQVEAETCTAAKHKCVRRSRSIECGSIKKCHVKHVQKVRSEFTHLLVQALQALGDFDDVASAAEDRLGNAGDSLMLNKYFSDLGALATASA